jgi:hypothetical protein
LSRPAAAKAIADSKKILKDAGKSVEGKGLGNNIRKIDEHLPKQHSILYHESVRDHLKEVTKGMDPDSQEYADAVEGGLNGIYYMIRSGDLSMYNN